MLLFQQIHVEGSQQTRRCRNKHVPPHDPMQQMSVCCHQLSLEKLDELYYSVIF